MYQHHLKPAAISRTSVLHLTPVLEVGAQAREVVDLAIQTHRAGWRPLVVSAGGALVLEAERAAVRHTALPLETRSLCRGWLNRARIEKLIDRERPVLIHAHGFGVAALASKLAMKKRLPFLIDVTETAPVTKGLKKALQLAANRGARFRVPSAFMAQHLREDFKLDTAFLYHIASGVDLQWFDAVRVTPERIHNLYKLWRLPEQATVIVMATPFAAGYGHKILLEALADLKGTDLYVVLIGEDKTTGMRAALEKEVIASGLEGRVIMPEACTDWPAACWLASLIVAPNAVARGQGPELLAAQAIGRPVIVTDCGANAEFVKKGETAWVIPPDDREALVAALREALAMSAARRIDLALCTRDFVRTFFPMETWRDSLFELYDAMLAQPMIVLTAPLSSSSKVT